jgi:hypothetical protein
MNNNHKQSNAKITTPIERDDMFNESTELMLEDELIEFLRIPQISRSKNYHNVVAHLKRHRGLPCIHICRQPLYSKESIRQWIRESAETSTN